VVGCDGGFAAVSKEFRQEKKTTKK